MFLSDTCQCWPYETYKRPREHSHLRKNRAHARTARWIHSYRWRTILPFFRQCSIHLITTVRLLALGINLRGPLIVWQSETERFRAEKWVSINPRPHLAPSFLSIVLARRCRRLLELSQSFLSYPSLFISALTCRCTLVHRSNFLWRVCPTGLTNQNTKH